MVYFQEKNTSDTTATASSSGFTPVFKIDDLLAITITSDDPEASVPFNLPPSANSGNNGYVIGNPAQNGYLIDAKGNITLPILGEMKASGLTRMELIAQIQQKLDGYLKNPVINVQIQNFKVTVLGDVKTPGTFKIPNERITVLEAIGLAGDLRMTGVRTNVLVIRDSSGVKSEYRLDLTGKAIFDSPAYYLQQNDVVYVQPNAAARAEGTMWKTTGAIFISLTSLVVTTIVILAR